MFSHKSFLIFSTALFVFVSVSFVSCKKNTEVINPEVESTEQIIAPNGFNYRTEKKVSINIGLQSGSGSVLSGVLVNILDKHEQDGGNILFTGITDEAGKLTGNVELPMSVESLIIDPAYVGVMRNAKVKIVSNALTATLGGPNGFSGNLIANQFSLNEMALMSGNEYSQHSVPSFTYMGEYDQTGLPKYLEATNDKIDSKLLSYINASLPESKPVPTYHPEYLNAMAATNLVVKEQSDVWITFVHEGAGFLNSLFYYTYPTGNAPKSVDEVKNAIVVLPNASLSGSGGSLISGNKIKLGRFDEGITIGFGIISNGWNANAQKVTNGTHVVFADDNLNPEKDTKLRRHTVLLFDASRNLFLTGFEDVLRDNPSCDNDFNDMIFYATSNPVTGLSHDDVNPIDTPEDTDKDGVSDVYDKFPNDPERAYIRYFPSEKIYGTLAFEDLWPAQGDYDMNDLVVNYRYAIISNAKNKAIEMKANYKVAAAGAAFVNGFGVQLPFEPGAVKSATGYKHSGAFDLKMDANGVEAGQTKAVIIPFDNAFSILKKAGGPVNTFKNVTKAEGEEIKMMLVFSKPLGNEYFESMIFNPFLMANKKRGAEVHLPDYLPTDLADTKLFNTSADNTVPAMNKYYKTKENMPFALNFIRPFSYPVEKVNIADAYYKYEAWVKTGGLSYPDWYLINNSDYIDAKKVMD